VETLTLPFKQDSTTVRKFTFWLWTFYFNRARLHGRTWISRITRPWGIYTTASRGQLGFSAFLPLIGEICKITSEGWKCCIPNDPRRYGYVHRITTCVREQGGVKYLQLIFFSWWIAVVRKDHGSFAVPEEE
jgi:hypothetical protein